MPARRIAVRANVPKAGPPRQHDTVLLSKAGGSGIRGDQRGHRTRLRFAFVGRLDDRGEDGMDLVRNIKKMYSCGDDHVHVLAASLRQMEHLLHAFSLGAELATAPAKLLDEWARADLPQPDAAFQYQAVDSSGKALKPIHTRNWI